MVTAVLRRGYSVEEITYPFDESGRGERRFGARRLVRPSGAGREDDRALAGVERYQE